MAPSTPTSHLLRFQIGPVQDFIAQARSTRDLWSGSYLLSWLVAAGIKALPQGAELIFPNLASQPLQHPLNPEAEGILVPNLPNIFIAKITIALPKGLAEKVRDAIKAEWQAIVKAVWDQRDKIGLPQEAEKRFFAQVDRHLSIAWQVTPLANDSPASYLAAYQHNGWLLDAVRQTRDFHAWDSVVGEGKNRLTTEKDSLSGKEEALVGGTEYQEKMVALKVASEKTIHEAYASLFAKHADYLGAIAIIKRCWHLAYLNYAHNPRLKTRSKDFTIRSIPAIAARTDEHDDNRSPDETSGGEKYIAAIAFDGDSIGRWVNGDFWPDKNALKQHHSDFSKALSNFALGEVRRIVEGPLEDQKQGIWKGQLIYAGGDDVVALVPADAALGIAAELRQAFQDATTNTPSIRDKPDASAGIAIAHIHSPLQDLIREAQKAEKRAKNTVGRPAFSITLMKRSGEISHWGSKWESKGLELYRAIAERLKPDGLRAKFPHRVCQLLTPYLTQNSGLSKQQDAITDINVAKDLIAREFAHAAERQGSKDLARELAAPLMTYLDGILIARAEGDKAIGKPSKQSATQELLTSVIALCTTVAFADRTKPAPAEKQPTAA
ncbi:MAG: type III-B CRISPR-associated protein Cas10/Cmr2 [Prosthecobacter sp.]|uniref:type III-B CRISPR-associated protein Cas10/Cmr2 n=1 Tax=Prosthecobacter sp. TaxID=1965333 RepID=UPI0039003F9A